MAKISPEPVYLKLHRRKILEQRIVSAQKLLRSCTLCPHKCGVNRAAGRLGAKARVAGLHRLDQRDWRRFFRKLGL